MADTLLTDADHAALWKRILPLLPTDTTFTHINGPAFALEKLERLCAEDPAVCAFAAPSNHALWRKMVLKCFDFAVHTRKRFNVGNYNDMDEEFDGGDGLVADTLREFERDHGNLSTWMILVEDLRLWTNLNVYFRPSQYDFLQRIQSGEAGVESAWPASEDAHSLFRELAMMKQVFGDSEGELTTFSDGEQQVDPVLLSKMDDALTGAGYPLLKHCGFLPHFWNCAEEPVSAMWSGLDSTRQPSDKVKQRETEKIFPHGRKVVVKEIQDTVKQWCSDWRHVRVNPGGVREPRVLRGQVQRVGALAGLCRAARLLESREHWNTTCAILRVPPPVRLWSNVICFP